MDHKEEEEAEDRMEVASKAVNRACTAVHPTDEPAATTPAIEAIRSAVAATISEIKDHTTDELQWTLHTLNNTPRDTDTDTDTPEHRHQIDGD